MTDALRFLAQAARRWRTVGAVAPSGRPLARAMARAVGPVAAGRVLVELGPGTGVVTGELAGRFPTARLMAVELLPGFAGRLAARFPGVAVVPGDAADLPAHLAGLGVGPADVAAVVSGLPLVSLPADGRRRVLAAVADTLQPGRRFVQFTYAERAWRRFPTPGLERVGCGRVWANLPPAAVLTFERVG